MRVATLTAYQSITVSEQPFDQQPQAGQALVKVKAVGICGTDLHIFMGNRPDAVPPRVMGHELSGEVLAVGDGVGNVAVGDRVVLDPVLSCGQCAMCQSGHPNVCSEVKCYGVQADGGYQDYIIVDASKLYAFPDRFSYQEAALAEPFSIAANMLSRAGVKAGETVVIIGAGTIGICTAQAAKGLGAKVLIADMVAEKLALAKQVGCDCVINSNQQSLAEAVKAFTPTGYVDVIIDCVGLAPLFRQTLDMATPLTRIVVIAFDGKEVAITPVEITRRELTIVGSRMNALQFPTVISWLDQGIVNPSVLISKQFPVEEIQQAFVYTLAHPEGIKTVITFD